MPTELILITVKTYPTLSVKYGELVCTAGLRQDGSWIRIYPVPFRQLEAYQKFPKYSFIEAEVVRNTKDARPESHKVNTDTLNLTGEVLSTDDHWRERRQWILKRGTVHTNLTKLIEATFQSPPSSPPESLISEPKPTSQTGAIKSWPPWMPWPVRAIYSQAGKGRTLLP